MTHSTNQATAPSVVPITATHTEASRKAYAPSMWPVHERAWSRSDKMATDYAKH